MMSSKKYMGRPCLHKGCTNVAVKDARCAEHPRPAFVGNYRTERLPEELELLDRWPPLNGRCEAFWESLLVNDPCSQEVVRYKEKEEKQ